jgi:hypothetical protein
LLALRTQVVIPLCSPAQSIRSRAIKSWNERPTWIKLFAVHNDKQAVEVEFTFGEVMPVQGPRATARRVSSSPR